jgi:DNA-binding MarR family transcriptional regulator
MEKRYTIVMNPGALNLALFVECCEKDIFSFKNRIAGRVLIKIASVGGECEFSDLSEAFDVTTVWLRQNVGGLVDRGLLECLIDIHDRRRKRLRLTVAARDLTDKFTRCVTVATRAFVDGKDPYEVCVKCPARQHCHLEMMRIRN